VVRRIALLFAAENQEFVVAKKSDTSELSCRSLGAPVEKGITDEDDLAAQPGPVNLRQCLPNTLRQQFGLMVRQDTDGNVHNPGEGGAENPIHTLWPTTVYNT
jgi:hypothetical protein